MANEYAQRADLKILLGIPAGTTTYDSMLDTFLESASRKIDDYCGRRFYVDSSASARYFTAHSAGRVLVADIASTDDLAVATDEGTGVWDTDWTRSSYTGYGFELEPLTPAAGWPYTDLVAIGSHCWPGRVAAVKVTAKWGWAAVPPAIEEACLKLAQAAWTTSPAASPAMSGATSIKLDGSDAVTYGNPSAVAEASAALTADAEMALGPYRKLPTP